MNYVRMYMGYIKHHTIVVTSFDFEKAKEVHKKAQEIFVEKCAHENGVIQKIIASGLISPIIEGMANSQFSFFIAPDGSKEGWGTSKDADVARKEFLDWLDKNNASCDYFEVIFGGDDDEYRITRSLETYLNDETE